MNIGIRIMGLALGGFLLIAMPGPMAAQEPANDVKRLKEQIAEQEARIKLLEKQNDLLKRELDQLRPTRSSLLESINTGSMLSGTFETLSAGMTGEISVKVTERNKDRFKGEWTTKTTTGSQSGELEGTITTRRLQWKTINTKNPVSASFVFVDDLLEGSWSNATSSGNGPATMKISK